MREAKIGGMGCQRCVQNVAETFESLGLAEIKVDLDSGSVQFTGLAREEAIRIAVSEAGYQVLSLDDRKD